MRNEEMKELLETHLKAIKAEMRAGHDVADVRFKEIITRQDKANGRLDNLEEQVNCIEKNEIKNESEHKDLNAKIDQRTRFLRWVAKYPVLAIILIFIAFSIISIISDTIGLTAIMQWLNIF